MMGCDDCEKAQGCEMDRVAYYRWKNANIAMVGCEVHLLEIFGVLNFAQKRMDNELSSSGRRE
jgi:hypothetical protein